MIDPDKPMRVNVQNSTVPKLEPASIGVTGGLLRALQTVAAQCCSSPCQRDAGESAAKAKGPHQFREDGLSAKGAKEG